ncbi:MAG: tyrosine-type recombinase/integrase [Chthoniobacteraceae bacterium]
MENENTRVAYENDVRDFRQFVGIVAVAEFRAVKRAHVIAWRKQLESRGLEPATIRRKLSAIASLYDYLCDRNAVLFNPVDGVKRPKIGSHEGKSPALGDEDAKAILDAPPSDTLKGLRDRAILSALLFHGLRRAELCSLRVGDLEARRGVAHLRVKGKGRKIRFIPVHPQTSQRIDEYLERAGHMNEPDAPLFQRVSVGTSFQPARPLTGNAVYKNVVRKYARQIGLEPQAICVHGLRATAATNALDHEADIAKVQEWLGHCEHFHNAALRPAKDEARGIAHFQD